MIWSDLLVDAFDRVAQSVPQVVDDLSPEQLTHQPSADANSVAWLVWHLARVEDDHLTGIAGGEQVWLSQGWEQRFGLPFDAHDIGYGQTVEQVRAVVVPAELLTGYYAAVHERTVAILRSMDAADLDRVVDRYWDPPVTAGVRLVSVINDVTQHVGQAAYVRGLLGASPVVG